MEVENRPELTNIFEFIGRDVVNIIFNELIEIFKDKLFEAKKQFDPSNSNVYDSKYLNDYFNIAAGFLLSCKYVSVAFTFYRQNYCNDKIQHFIIDDSPCDVIIPKVGDSPLLINKINRIKFLSFKKEICFSFFKERKDRDGYEILKYLRHNIVIMLNLNHHMTYGIKYEIRNKKKQLRF